MRAFLCWMVIVVVSVTTFGQPFTKPRNAIFFENKCRFSILTIAEGQEYSFRLSSGRELSGKIQGIKGDTIRLKDTLVIASDIVELWKYSLSGLPHPFLPRINDQSTALVIRLADTAVWKLVCPPPETFQNLSTYQHYLQTWKRDLKRRKYSMLQPFRYRNFLKLNVAKLAHLEVALSYERVIGSKFSVENELSVIFGVKNADAHYTINYPLYNYNGLSLTTYPKFFVINPRTYLGLVFMYRYLWFDQVRTGWPGKNGNSSYLQNQVRQDLGMSLRFGIMHRYGRFVVDWYVGGGLKIILLHQEIYATYPYQDSMTMYWRYQDHSPDVYEKVLLGPVFNAGIKIGLGF